MGEGSRQARSRACEAGRGMIQKQQARSDAAVCCVVCGVRHAGVVWGGVGGVLFFVAACGGVLPGVGVWFLCVVVV